jgi:glyoxylase-like metal-dependent hydrolase (beta-lactamase superfamily II)
MKLERLSKHVYAAPGDFRQVRPWIAIIVGPQGSVLVDSGNGPVHAEEIKAALEAMGAPPVTHILLTHHHWDHVFGNCAFPGTEIVAHALTQHHLQIMAEEPWSVDYLREKAGDDPTQRTIAAMMIQAVPDWQAFKAVVATTTFTDTYRLDLGSVQLLQEHVGGQHEPDQCIVRVLPDNVLILGDAVYGRGMRAGWDYAALAAELEKFLSPSAQYYIEGHRNPANEQQFRERIAELRRLAIKQQA